MSKEKKDPKYQSTEDLLDRVRALALEKALERIESGKASDGLLQMFLKGVLPESQIEQQVKQKSLYLMEAKTEKLKAEVTSEETFQNAMAAFAKYSGHNETVEVYEDE